MAICQLREGSGNFPELSVLGVEDTSVSQGNDDTNETISFPIFFHTIGPTIWSGCEAECGVLGLEGWGAPLLTTHPV